MAVIVLMMLIAGQRFAGELADEDRIFSLTGHSSLGVLIVIFLVLRLTLRFTGKANRPVHNIAPWQDAASKVVQLGIYLLLFYLPITGFLTARAHSLPVRPFGLPSISTPDPSVYETIRPFHEYGTKALAILLLLHIAAALYHRFGLRDKVMGSMSLLRQKD